MTLTRGEVLELALLTMLAAALSAVPVLADGAWGWSWDGLNHHLYLGLVAQSPRWHLDALAASAQSYQYPYLYWPFYWVSTWPVSGVTAGVAYSMFQAALLMPPLWLAAYHLLPRQGSAAQAVFERAAACALAASSVVLMAAVGTSSNDLLTVVPLLWAIALMAVPTPATARRAAMAATLWGVSTAFKWSNGLALPWLLIWCWQRDPDVSWLRRAVLLALSAAVGFGLAYAPWGWQLWQQTGNPFHPFFGWLVAR